MRHGCHGDCVPLAPEHTIRILIWQRMHQTKLISLALAGVRCASDGASEPIVPTA